MPWLAWGSSGPSRGQGELLKEVAGLTRITRSTRAGTSAGGGSAAMGTQ